MKDRTIRVSYFSECFHAFLAYDESKSRAKNSISKKTVLILNRVVVANVSNCKQSVNISLSVRKIKNGVCVCVLESLRVSR